MNKRITNPAGSFLIQVLFNTMDTNQLTIRITAEGTEKAINVACTRNNIEKQILLQEQRLDNLGKEERNRLNHLEASQADIKNKLRELGYE